MRQGTKPETDLVHWCMTPLWKGKDEPQWVKEISAFSPAERTVTLSLLKEYLEDHNIAYEDHTTDLDEAITAAKVFIGRDEVPVGGLGYPYTYSLIGASASNMRYINLTATPHPSAQFVRGDMNTEFANWAYYFNAQEPGYTRCVKNTAMKFYLRCLVKGYAFTEDSALTDTVIETLPQDLKNYHAHLQRIHDEVISPGSTTADPPPP